MCDVKATLPGAELKPTRPQLSGRHESGDALPYGERQRPASEALAAIQSDYVVRCAAEALLNPPACDLSGE